MWANKPLLPKLQPNAADVHPFFFVLQEHTNALLALLGTTVLV